MIGSLVIYDYRSFSIKQYQELHIIPIPAYITSQITQGSKLQMFFKDSLSEVVLRKNEP